MKASKLPTSPTGSSKPSREAGASRRPPAYGISLLDDRGMSLPAPVSAKMERAFASDFSGVRVHLDHRPAQFGAQAFTRGSNIHFAAGRYDPHGMTGQVLIGHELAHVVQQSQGRVLPTRQRSGLAINDDPTLEREADVSAERAARGQFVGALGPARCAPATAGTSVVQGFGIDSRTWKDVTAVRNLSKGAYLVSAGNEQLIIKLSGQGTVEIEPGEGPTQETLGAGLANMLGITAAQTVQIISKHDEGRTIIAKLHALGGGAQALAGMLAKVESFLVMEFVPGDDLQHADRQYLSMTRAQRETLYASIGRMYAFDVFVDNTDRFIKLNLGNMRVRDDGALVGIDQMIQGVTDMFAKMGVSSEAALSRLAPLLDPDKRRAFSLDMFDGIARGVSGRFIARDEAFPFAVHFELGLLEMIGRIAALKPEQVTGVVAKLPVEAQAAVKAVGLSGLGQTQAAFAEYSGQAAEQAEFVETELRGRTLLDGVVKTKLAVLNGERQTILDAWRAEVEKLYAKSVETEKWMWGAEAYWTHDDRKTAIKKLAAHRIEELEAKYKAAMIAAVDDPHSALLREQATMWFGGIAEIRTELAHVLDSPATVRKTLVAVHRRIRQESRRPGFALARP